MTVITTPCGEVLNVEAVCADAGDEYGHQLIVQNIDLVISAAAADVEKLPVKESTELKVGDKVEVNLRDSSIPDGIPYDKFKTKVAEVFPNNSKLTSVKACGEYDSVLVFSDELKLI